jgi:carboxypeptidase T
MLHCMQSQDKDPIRNCEMKILTMSKFALIARLAVLFTLTGAAAVPAAPTLSAPALIETHPVVARIAFQTQAELARLAQTVDIWEVDHAQGWVLAPLQPPEVELLSAESAVFQIDLARTTALLSAPEQARLLSLEQTSGIPGYSCYRTVEETYHDLERLAFSYPQLAYRVDIGDSWEKITPGGAAGYDLIALVLTNKARPGPKPAFFLLAAIHAREYATAETAVRFAEHLLTRYSLDADITWLLDEFEVHIVAQANPDGRKQAEAGYYWRKNTDRDDGCNNPSYWGTDLNRNSSFHWAGPGSNPWACSDVYHGPAPASEPEVQALQTYLSALFPDRRGPLITDPAPPDTHGLFITLHSYGEMVLWPWGDSSLPAPNGAALQTLGRKLAFFNGYRPGQSITLYPTSGTNDDWVYGELGTAAYTFELGTFFFQDCPSFESQIYPDNLEALLYAFKSARRPYLTPAGPDTLSLALPANTVLASQPLVVSARADDTRYLSPLEPVQIIAAARASIDRPAWASGQPTFALSAVDGVFDSPAEAVAGMIPTTGLTPGRHTLFVESRDTAGNWGPPSAIFFYVLNPQDSTVLKGQVRDARTNLPVEAVVHAGPHHAAAVSGAYQLPVPSGAVTVTAVPAAADLAPAVGESILAPAGETVVLDLIAYPTCAAVSTGPDCIPPLSPTAAFTTQGVRSLGTGFDFLDRSTGSHPLEYAWDFGDGSGSSALSNPIYHYTETGVYTVTLTVTNEVGTSTFSGVISVMEADWIPVESVQLSASGRVSEGEAALIEARIQPDTANTPYQYEADFGDGSPRLGGESDQAILSFTHVYSRGGVYPVQVRVWNAPTTFPTTGQLNLSVYRPIFLPLIGVNARQAP